MWPLTCAQAAVKGVGGIRIPQVGPIPALNRDCNVPLEVLILGFLKMNWILTLRSTFSYIGWGVLDCYAMGTSFSMVPVYSTSSYSTPALNLFSFAVDTATLFPYEATLPMALSLGMLR